VATVEAFEAMTRKVETTFHAESVAEGEKRCGRKPGCWPRQPDVATQ
jgi:hypothetical protein